MPICSRDRITCDEWLRTNIAARDARAILEWFIRVCLAAEPYEVSFLQFLFFLKAGGKALCMYRLMYLYLLWLSFTGVVVWTCD
jgi:hypothetical protein